MKILVCISKTPDTTAKISFTQNNTKFNSDGVQWIINPYDEWYSLVRAIELKEKDPSVVIHLVTVGLADTEPIIRKALAIGGDEAIRVNADSADSYYVAAQLAEVARQGGYDLIFTGKETIDYNGSSIGGMLAELLDLPYISLAVKFELKGTTATVTREIEGGEETDDRQPAGSCELSERGSRTADPKYERNHGCADQAIKGTGTGSRGYPDEHRFLRTAACQGRRQIGPADNPAELIRLLHEEAKVF